MQFLYQYPEVHGADGDMLAAGPVAEVAWAAEAAGWHGFAFTEHPAPSARWLASGGHQSLDPFVALGHAAAATDRLRLVTFLTVAPYRNPLLLAKAAATVDVLSGGRFVLGAGAGYLKSEFRALGVDFDERNELLDEALDVLPLHWSGEPFSYEGRHFSAREVQARPAPVQQPIPIWLGGNSTRTLRRVAERAQGWMPMLVPAEVAATTRTPHLATVADLAAAVASLKAMAGEGAAALDVVCAHDVELDDVERHRDVLGRLAEAGATWILSSHPARSAAATREYLAGVGETYLSASG